MRGKITWCVALLLVAAICSPSPLLAASVNRSGTYACSTERELDQLLNEVNQRRDEGLFATLMNSGKCTALEEGTKVLILESKQENDRAKIQLEDSGKTYWTLRNAVNER